MIDKNYDFLKNQLKLTGFGEGHAETLKAELEKNQPQFVLTHKAQIGKDEAVATMHFRKSDSSDMYFFNKYDMQLKKEGDDAAMRQTVYLRNKEDNISFKEAYNLMNDRSVFKERTTKEGEKYQTWMKLDFKSTDAAGNFKMKAQSFGYDLEKAINKYPITELKDPDVRPQIVASLQRGNRQEVNLETDGKTMKIFIEAHPASGMNNALKVYDAGLQRVQGLTKGEEQENGQSKKEEQKSKVKIGEADEPDRKPKTQKKSRGIA